MHSIGVSNDPGTFDVLPPIDGSLPPIEYSIPDLPPLGIPSVDVLDSATLPESQNGLTLFDPVLWDPFNPANVGAGGAGDYSLSPTGWDFSGATPNSPPIAPTVAPASNSASFNATNVVQGVTNAALAAIKLVSAFQALNHPSIQTTARVVRSNGSVAVVGNNGLIQTRDSAGRVTATRPPVGVPQATLDGNYIVNNGDGTYTVVSTTGQTAKYQYAGGAASGLLTSSTGLLIGGGLLLFALSRKGRK